MLEEDRKGYILKKIGGVTIAKTKETTDLERAIYYATQKMGTFGCFEVTIGYWGKERVDYITYDTKGVWRCYEIKVSKADFYRGSKPTFVGHYNYYVLTEELYEIVKDDIPKGIGAYVGGRSVKRASRKMLKENEAILYNSMIRSLSREFNKQYRSGTPNVVESLERQVRNARSDRDRFRTSYNQIMNAVYSKFGRQWLEELMEEERNE